MLFKSDREWDAIRNRFEAFWNQEMVDRALISIRTGVPYDPDTLPPILKEQPMSDEDQVRFWTDAQFLTERFRAGLPYTYFAGDAFPIAPMNLGASGHAAFYRGAKYQFTSETMWFFPSHELEDLEGMEFDENSFLYRKTIEMAQTLAQDSQGDYIISQPDDTGNADALAFLLGSDNLMLDMLEEPEAVHRALDQIQKAYESIQRRVYDIVKENNYGGSTINWLSTWAPGFHAQEQCDMSVMISNSMFREYILPELQTQSKFLEYPLYHLDGFQELRHLEDFLSIPELRAIQWVQSPSAPPITEYIDELKKIQAAGKSLVLQATPEGAKILLENLSAKGLLLLVGTAGPEEADAVVQMVSDLSHP